MKSESIKEITTALAKAQVTFKPIKRTEKVGYDTTKGRKQYNYAPLNEVIEATKHALSDNGLAVTQTTKLIEGNTILETLLSHSSGEWLSGELYVGKQDLPPQTEGSALTYKRRYGMSAILCVASEDDDDGETDTDRKPPKIEPNTEKGECTAEQRKRIVAKAKEKGYSNELAVSIMTRLYEVSSSKELTAEQAEDFLKVMEAGKYLKENIEIEKKEVE